MRAQKIPRSMIVSVLGSIWSPKEPPRYPHEHPKGAQEGPKTLSRPSSDRKRRFFRNVSIHTVISRFSRVGGSSWELKIDPKKLQERIRNDFEEDRTRRSEKKDNKNDKKTTQDVIPIIGVSLFGVQGSLGRTTYQRKLTNLTSAQDLTRRLAKGQANLITI